MLLADLKAETIYIVTDNPSKLESVVKHRWRREIQRALKQRANAANAVDLIRLSSQIAIMESVTLACAPPIDLLQADVVFIEPEEQWRLSPQDIVIVTKPFAAGR